MNMGSYNYLGFAQPIGPCADDAEIATRSAELVFVQVDMSLVCTYQDLVIHFSQALNHFCIQLRQ